MVLFWKSVCTPIYQLRESNNSETEIYGSKKDIIIFGNSGLFRPSDWVVAEGFTGDT